MRIGIMGVGMVGGTLKQWLENNTSHELRLYDPPKGIKESLKRCDAIFICIPVQHGTKGQNQKALRRCVKKAKKYTPYVFIKSTVTPKTNDNLGTISCPEFLTARRAYEDMDKLPVIVGEQGAEMARKIFLLKKVIPMKNYECELAKLGHNCFGALKVTYFNILNDLCEKNGASYEVVKKGFMMTGYIEEEYTRIAQDGQKGYGGACFPTNVKAFARHLDGNQRLLLHYTDLVNKEFRK